MSPSTKLPTAAAEVRHYPRRRALDLRLRPTRAEVDLAALRANVAEVRSLALPAEVMAVVKANAYGHGAVEVARALELAGVRFLGVALIEEGMELRNGGVRAPILVLGGSYAGGYDVLVEYELTPTVFRPDHLEGLAQAARTRGTRVDAHLKVDTGMGRIGVLPEELPAFLAMAARHPEVRLDGLASHFASADVADAELTRAQLAAYRRALATLEANGIHPAWRHLSNSAGLLHLPEVHDGKLLNLVRPGLMLYGYPPTAWLADRIDLRPVLSWKTGVSHLKAVPEGTPVSYGSHWVAPRPSVIATLPIGYADGYHRAYSNKAEVLIRGQRARIVGRVCMDMCMVDVTEIPGVEVGDEVVLLGAQGTERVSAEELADFWGTISYEVLCTVGARVPRVAVDPT